MQNASPAAIDDKTQARRVQRGWCSYLITTLIFSLIITPVLCQLLFFILFGVVAVAVIAMIYMAALIARKNPEIPSSPTRRFLPILIPYACHMLLWALVFGISGYSFASPGWAVFFWLTPTRFISNVLSMIINDQMTFLFVTAVELAAMLLGVQIAALLRRQRLSLWPVRKAFVVALAAVIAIDGVIAFQLNQRGQSYVSTVIVVDKVGNKGERYKHAPLAEDKVLGVLYEDPEATIDNQPPRLDGATAEFPVYNAVARALYKGLDEDTALGMESISKPLLLGKSR